MMFAYYCFKDLQPFFENLHKEDFVVLFDCKEPGVLNIRILYDFFYSFDRIERLKTLFEAFKADRKFFIEFYAFEGTYLSIRYNVMGVEE